MVALYFLATPAALLAGAAAAIALPAGRAAIFNPSAHGLSEVMYAFTSAANSNGSAFGRLSGNTPFYNTLLAQVMLLGRYVPLVFVLGWPAVWPGSGWRPVVRVRCAPPSPRLSRWSSASP